MTRKSASLPTAQTDLWQCRRELTTGCVHRTASETNNQCLDRSSCHQLCKITCTCIKQQQNFFNCSTDKSVTQLSSEMIHLMCTSYHAFQPIYLWHFIGYVCVVPAIVCYGLPYNNLVDICCQDRQNLTHKAWFWAELSVLYDDIKHATINTWHQLGAI